MLIFDVKQRGIYYASPPDPEETKFYFYDFANGKPKMIASAQQRVTIGFSVSPDERSILCTQMEGQKQSDLMLVEDFRREISEFFHEPGRRAVKVAVDYV